MSSFIYYKIAFEGKIEAVYELIRSRDWKIDLKMPDNSFLLMKVPEDIEDEVLFLKDMVFDEKTNSKFGKFTKIAGEEFESSSTLDIPDLSISSGSIKKTVSNDKIEEISQIVDKKPSFKEDNIDQKINQYKQNSMIKIKNFFNVNLANSINIGEIKKNISVNYKDPYDYFFTKNYLISFLVVALVIFMLFKL